MLQRWVKQGMSGAPPRPSPGGYTDELMQAADEPNIAAKGTSANVEPSTAHGRNAESATGGVQSTQGPPARENVMDSQGDDVPGASAWIANNDEWYQPTAPPPTLQSPPPRPPRRVVENKIAVKSVRPHRQYDFSRVTLDDELSKSI